MEEKQQKEVVKADVAKAPVTAMPGSRGGLIPQNFEQLYRLAHIMAQSGLMPKGLTNVASVFVAVQMGLEVGLSPMQAVQNIAVINGRPAVWGDAALGLIQGSGLLEEFKEWHEGEEDNYVAKCTVKRKGDPHQADGEFSIADAKRAGLMPNHAESPWTKYPKRMLQWRARTWPLRDKFADVLKGLRLAEEVLDLKEVGEGVFGIKPNGETGLPESFENITVPGEVEDLVKQFDKATKDEDQDTLKAFLEKSAKHFEMSVFEIKATVMKDTDGLAKFLEQFRGTKTETTEKDPIREEYINLRGAGFPTWVHKNLERIPGMAPHYQEEIRAKWAKVCPDATYPLDNKESPTQDEIAPPGGENEGTEPPPPSPEDEAIMSLIQGSHFDIANRLCVPCPNHDGRSVFAGHCNEKCPDRQGCPTFEEYDKR